DARPERAERAFEIGALDAVGVDPKATLTFVATPAGAVVEVAREALARGGFVTDVAGVKEGIVTSLPDARFVGGHPMAGSEQEGVDGADADLFQGATWVLTPSDATDPAAFATVRAVVASLGANVVEVPARRHDDLVALVSHVPHLTAATLMNLASDAASEHATLLRLAAGGFRDMTRIAAGHPGIWPDVCVDNRAGILEVLDRLVAALADMRDVIASQDREGLLKTLERAREARVNLPAGVGPNQVPVELRVPVPDQPGVLAEVTTVLGERGVNIYDLEIAHSGEGAGGVLVLVIDGASLEVARQALTAGGHKLSVRQLGPHGT
ncbi:MAG: prephenate dehydrogenase/arogenate dehydrogenase family protein, partial [Acidimicrobiaceae bacterium]|nr:prephenate dehydrogenase/arogenate dehydrogenase family protein [Acidimicrobiaceae bacterium]